MGKPPPIAFDKQSTSGIMPDSSNAKLWPVLPTPHWISSKINRMPCSSQMRRSSRNQNAGAGITPPSPCTGSTMIAAGFMIPASSSFSRRSM
ncbi:Uncharacterised protein [Vibrio cholerae]|nr:Uncharacterised protein [Vibrio cholerae]